MKKYVYENATVYITIPTEKHLANIREATEQYLRNLLTKGVDISGRHVNGNRGHGKDTHRKRPRNKKARKNDSTLE